MQSWDPVALDRNAGGREEDLGAANFSRLANGQGRSRPRKRDADSRQRELDLDGLVPHVFAMSERGVVCGVGNVPSIGGGGGIILEVPGV